ncbi:TIGR00270 family protein [Candidatus Woesearchaeota archaeon]|nr:TIGR00270 family protein [Candidatus Woesearchaeota archaeon]
MGCDMCGRHGDMYNAIIEDVELSVCESCAKFGKVMGRKNSEYIPERRPAMPGHPDESIELIVDNYAQLIKGKREAMGLTQKEFAQKLNEKESTIHKIETGGLEPPMALARKLEKLLKVKLIEEHQEVRGKTEKRKEEGLTLGDFISLKK